MGYRSEVALYLAKGIGFPKQDQAPDDLIVDERGTLAIWESVKWSKIYRDCKVVEDFLATLKEEDYLFLRIGEELNDNEIWGSAYENPFNLAFNRTISLGESQVEALQAQVEALSETIFDLITLPEGDDILPYAMWPQRHGDVKDMRI